MSTGGIEAAESAPATPSLLKTAESGKTLMPTFEVVKSEAPKTKRKVARKATAKKATKKVAKKATKKKVAKKAKAAKKVAKTARQLGAARAAALRRADPKLRSSIKAKREELKKLQGRVKACGQQLAALEKKL